jgi:hypothetical protein
MLQLGPSWLPPHLLLERGVLQDERVLLLLQRLQRGLDAAAHARRLGRRTARVVRFARRRERLGLKG